MQRPDCSWQRPPGRTALRSGKAEKYGEQTLPEWRALYAQRQAVERCFSRLKGLRALNNINLQGQAKVTVHCYIALITLQAAAGSRCQ